MIFVSVRSNVDQVAAQLDDTRRRQLPFALSLAINRVAKSIADEERAEMRRIFDRPTPYTIGALRVAAATKQSPTARVWFKDETSKGTPADRFLLPQVEGGARSHKRFERALQRIGILAANEYAVPAAGAKLDAYGNMSRGQIVQILSYLRAFGEQGYRANSTETTRAKLAKGTRSRRGIEYFVSRGRGTWFGRRAWKFGRMQNLPRGVYVRTPFGFGQAIKPVLLFVSKAQYHKRFDFYGVAERTTDRDFERELRRAVDEALASAR